MIESERVKLLYGPYAPPNCQPGDKLNCEFRHRLMTVNTLTTALIPWPSEGKKRRASPIVCGDLIRAIRTESALALCHHWGVAKKTVWKWRKALGVPRWTNGSRRLRIEYAAEHFTPEVRAKGQAAMGRPDVRAKLSAIRKGRRPHPNTIEACRELGRRPKSEEWKRAMSVRSKKMWENPEEYGLPARRKWTDDEIALLGTASDKVVAAKLGLPVKAVKYKRESLHINLLSRRWSDQELASLGTASDSALARKFGKSQSAVRRKREHFKIPRFVQKPWSPSELAALGTSSDRELAQKFDRTSSAVQSKREQLKIPAFTPRWTPAELSLLGTDTDRKIARLLDRTEEAVKVRRVKSKIPAYR